MDIFFYLEKNIPLHARTYDKCISWNFVTYDICVQFLPIHTTRPIKISTMNSSVYKDTEFFQDFDKVIVTKQRPFWAYIKGSAPSQYIVK